MDANFACCIRVHSLPFAVLTLSPGLREKPKEKQPVWLAIDHAWAVVDFARQRPAFVCATGKSARPTDARPPCCDSMGLLTPQKRTPTVDSILVALVALVTFVTFVTLGASVTMMNMRTTPKISKATLPEVIVSVRILKSRVDTELKAADGDAEIGESRAGTVVPVRASAAWKQRRFDKYGPLNNHRLRRHKRRRGWKHFGPRSRNGLGNRNGFGCP